MGSMGRPDGGVVWHDGLDADGIGFTVKSMHAGDAEVSGSSGVGNCR